MGLNFLLLIYLNLFKFSNMDIEKIIRLIPQYYPENLHSFSNEYELSVETQRRKAVIARNIDKWNDFIGAVKIDYPDEWIHDRTDYNVANIMLHETYVADKIYAITGWCFSKLAPVFCYYTSFYDEKLDKEYRMKYGSRLAPGGDMFGVPAPLPDELKRTWNTGKFTLGEIEQAILKQVHHFFPDYELMSEAQLNTTYKGVYAVGIGTDTPTLFNLFFTDHFL